MANEHIRRGGRKDEGEERGTGREKRGGKARGGGKHRLFYQCKSINIYNLLFQEKYKNIKKRLLNFTLVVVMLTFLLR